MKVGLGIPVGAGMDASSSVSCSGFLGAFTIILVECLPEWGRFFPMVLPAALSGTSYLGLRYTQMRLVARSGSEVRTHSSASTEFWMRVSERQRRVSAHVNTDRFILLL